MWKVFPVAASLAQLLGTPLKQSTLNHSAAEFETSNTTHTTKVESSRFSFTIFYAHAKSTTHANSGSPYLRPSLPPWQLCQSWHCLGCLGVHLVSFAVRLLRVCIMISTFSRQPYQREAATAPRFPSPPSFSRMPRVSCGSHRNNLATTLSKREHK